MHVPAHPGCDVCKSTNVSHVPARRQKRCVRAGVYGARLYIDLVGPAAQGDAFSDKYLLCVRDEYSDFAVCAAMPNNIPSTVTDTFKGVSPLIKPIATVRPDWGGEFACRFEALCRRDEIAIERGIAGGPQTFSREARWHRTLEEGTRAALYQSGISHRRVLDRSLEPCQTL